MPEIARQNRHGYVWIGTICIVVHSASEDTPVLNLKRCKPDVLGCSAVYEDWVLTLNSENAAGPEICYTRVQSSPYHCDQCK